MAREGRWGLTPAYTAYRDLGSDSDGQRTGGEFVVATGGEGAMPGKPKSREGCQESTVDQRGEIGANDVDLSFFPQEPRFSRRDLLVPLRVVGGMPGTGGGMVL
jgi:hypothetical protein